MRMIRFGTRRSTRRSEMKRKEKLGMVEIPRAWHGELKNYAKAHGLKLYALVAEIVAAGMAARGLAHDKP